MFWFFCNSHIKGIGEELELICDILLWSFSSCHTLQYLFKVTSLCVLEQEILLHQVLVQSFLPMQKSRDNFY